MPRALDFSSFAIAVLAVHRAWFWRWACCGLLLAVVSGICGVPMMGWVAAAALWLLGGALWFKYDAERVLRQMANVSVNSVGASPNPVMTSDWHNWVAGWYWETDAEQRLKVLKPGPGGEIGLTVDWPVLTQFVAQRPVWPLCWSGGQAPAGGAHGCGAFGLALQQQSAWSASEPMPWPDALTGAVPFDAGLVCTVRAVPLRTADGEFIGHCGVLVPVVPQATQAGAVLSALPQEPVAPLLAADAPPMSEGEQEVLRYALSHDLRAPLRVVDGFVRIVKEDYGATMDRMGNDHLDRVLAAAARMNGMIDAILAQAQLAGTPLARVDVDVTELANEVGQELLGLLPAGVLAEVVVQPALVAQADALLLRRILENLIGNALKYSAKVASPKVEVGAMASTNPTVYYVRDNGAGFDMQHADKLFGLFQRLHSAKEFAGTGVGLAGVQNIVRRHGGRVWAEARPGDGACFYFTLMDAAQAQQR